MNSSVATGSVILPPWRDRSGRFSVLKAATFLALFVPGMINAFEYALGSLGPRPFTALIQAMGLWAIRLLFISLSITPARQVLRAPRLVLARRMIGVAAFLYASIHLFAFAADKMLEEKIIRTPKEFRKDPPPLVFRAVTDRLHFVSGCL